MPEVTHFRWVPESALPQVAQRFDAVLQPWAQSWGLASAPGEVRRATVDELKEKTDVSADETQPSAWVSLAGEAGPWVRTPPSLGGDLAAELFGPEAARSQLAPDVAQRAVQALQAQLQQSLAPAVPDATPPIPGPPRVSTLGHWGVRYQVGIGPRGVAVLATTDWLHRQGWLERASPPALKPHAWGSTLARLPLSVRVDLGHASVPVGDLFNLNVGDVILMTQTIAQALPVRVLGTDVQLRAHLGQVDARRAVQFISTTPTGTP
jgi:flagellar motor switch/type III secretory pathway protein FliN